MWKQRFLAPQIYWTAVAQLAPTRGVAGCDRSGILQLYAWQVATGELQQLTERPEGVPFGQISPDGSYIYYLQDHRGDEIGHYVRVPFEGGEPEDLTPDFPLYSSWGFSLSGVGNLLGFTVANAEGCHVYLIDIGPDNALSAPRLLYQTRSLIEGPLLSHHGETAVLASAARSDSLQFSLLAFDTMSGEVIGELWDGPESSINPRGFSHLPHDSRLLATTNVTGVRRPLLWNPRTGERTDFELGDLRGEVLPWDWSADARYVLLCSIVQAVQTLYVYELARRTLTPLQHPSGTYWWAYFGPGGDIYAEWEDSTHSRQVLALDSQTGHQKRIVLVAGEAIPGHPWTSITFVSSDGQLVQGWLGVPHAERPFPTILEMHGGPASWTSDAWSPESQAWLDHGFAFLSINYRGSSSFGRAFEEQIYGNLGHWEVEDMVAARTWLIQKGIARADQILLTGWSYGGYLTLHALGKRPELWAGGLAGTAIADWTLLYQDAGDNMKRWAAALFRGTPEDKPEQYAMSSPITYVAQVSAPVLVIQGRNDTRCPARQLQAYLEKMRTLGKSIEVHWFDTGHGSLVTEERIEHQELMLRFAHSVLKKD